VTRINPSVDPQMRSFDVEAMLDNHDGARPAPYRASARCENFAGGAVESGGGGAEYLPVGTRVHEHNPAWKHGPQSSI